MPRDWTSLFHTQLEEPDMHDFLKNIEGTMDEWMHDILRFVIQDVVTFLKSYTSKMNPPRYKRKYHINKDSVREKVTSKNVAMISPNRPAHPGGWSDIEQILRDNYYGRVEKSPEGGWRGVIGNRAGHAAFVEAKDGFFVVTGVFWPGGPVMRALNKYMQKYAPGTKIRNEMGMGVEVSAKGTGIIDAVTASAG